MEELIDKKPRWRKALFIFLSLGILIAALSFVPRTEIRIVTTKSVIGFRVGKEPAAQWTRVGPDILRFQGSWMGDGSSKAQLEALIDEPVDVVIITSSNGGVTHEAIADAELLLPFKPRIVVEELCASSCANYLLPIAREINIRNRAAVAYHGTVCEIDALSIGCRQERDFWEKLPNGDRIAELPVGLRSIDLPSRGNGWMPTADDFINAGYPPVIFDWYPEPYTFAPGGIYVAPIP